METKNKDLLVYCLPCHPDASLLLLHHHHHNHHHHLNGHLLLQLLIAPPNFSSSYSCLLLPLTLLLLLQLLLLTPAPAAVHSPPPHQHQHQDYRHFLHRQHLPLFTPPVVSSYSKFLWVQNYISFSFSWNSNIKSCRPKVKNLYNCLFLEFEMGWPKNCTFVIYVWGLALLLMVGNSCLAN